jgi:hypothetical protein
MWSWNQIYQAQALADTRIQGHMTRAAIFCVSCNGGFKSLMSDNSDSDDPAKFEAF